METQLGYHGATQQSWGRDSMRELLTALMREYPRAGLKELIKLYDERAQEEREYRLAAVHMSVVNTYNSIIKLEQEAEAREAARKRAASPEAKQTKERARRETAAKVEEVIAKVEQVILLNLEMPNGKRMRNCTGAEMATFGKGYQKIAAKVGSTKLVGHVLDEKQVRALMK